MELFETVIVILGIIIALAFNFSNGRNDASNTIATVIATRALSPRAAIIIAAACCLAGPFIFSTAVAKTIGKGIVDPSFFNPIFLFVGLCGAVFWVNFCTHKGIPVSSSHALVGGLMGAGVAAGGLSVIVLPTYEMISGMFFYLLIGAAAGLTFGLLLALMFRDEIKLFAAIGLIVGAVIGVPAAMITGVFEFNGIPAILLFICVSPILGLVVSYLFTTLLSGFAARHIKNPMKMNKWFQRLQILGSGFQALSLGGNDAQNAMGIIVAILLSVGMLSPNDPIPFWVVLLSAVAISLGLLSGGWKVISKVGRKITKILPYQGFSASFSGGLVLSFMTSFGVPVSTTHVASGTIMGTGVTRGVGAVNWRTVRQMVSAWIITIPCAGAVSFAAYLIVSLIFGL